MSGLNYMDLCLLCSVTKERLYNLDQLIEKIGFIEGKSERLATISLELVETYQAEKVELETLLEKLQALRKEM